MRFVTLLAAAATLALGACASTTTTADNGRAPTADGRDCFRSSQVSDYEILDPSHVRLRTGNENFIATLRGSTMQIDSASVINIRSERNLICDGDAQGVYLEANGQSVAVADIERVDSSRTAAFGPDYVPGPIGIRAH